VAGIYCRSGKRSRYGQWRRLAGVAGLPYSNEINGCDSETPQLRPAKRRGNPRLCRTSLTAERLRELLHYNEVTGEFRRRVTVRYNARAGDLAGSTDKRGYRQINVDGTVYRGHRLAILYTTGAWPDHDVDHRDGVRSNNAFRNLRPATMSQNIANSRRPLHNTSGFKGVGWDKKARKWRATIEVRGRRIYLGLFETLEAAAASYHAAAIQHFGEFARAG
jgi:hypothetical protein